MVSVLRSGIRKLSRVRYNTNMEDLKNLKRLIVQLNQTNSSTDKKAILKAHPECKKILRYTYNPFKQYYLTSDNLKKNAHLDTPEHRFDDLYELLDALHARRITGHEAIATMNAFILDNKAYADVILRIVDRNLKTRTDAKLINKVWPGAIPSFDVALAQKFDDYADKVDFVNDRWYSSRKLDGVRVLTIIDENGDIGFWSRKGKEFTTLENVRKALKPYGFKNLVFDGEMCIVDENGDENFTSMIKLIRRKDFTVENPKYKIFDMLTIEDFNNQKGSTKLSSRLKKLYGLGFDGEILDPVEQIRIESASHLTDMANSAVEAGWEGLIIRKDVGYEGKRTNNMLKVKKFYDDEYVVKDLVFGPIRFIENGREKEEIMLSAITIEHKGYPVSVGSGFSMEFRQQVYNDNSLLLGKTVTIAYFEETTNKQGTISLRFPTVKAIYENGRDI